MIDERFYDLVYEARRSGRDPDSLSVDKYDAWRASGYDPEEITVDMVTSRQEPPQAGQQG